MTSVYGLSPDFLLSGFFWYDASVSKFSLILKKYTVHYFLALALSDVSQQAWHCQAFSDVTGLFSNPHRVPILTGASVKDALDFKQFASGQFK
jgi:hypothetical protein